MITIIPVLISEIRPIISPYPAVGAGGAGSVIDVVAGIVVVDVVSTGPGSVV